MTGLLLCNHIAIPIFVEYRIPIPTFDSSRLHRESEAATCSI